MKTLLLTGSSGFLGTYILEEIQRSFECITIGRASNNHISCDLGHAVPQVPQVDWVVHCAGKAHSIPKNKEEESQFFRMNYEGTKNLVLALEKSNHLPEQLVFISTVSVYGKESGENLNESTPLAGGTPYALSKIKAEEYLRSWGQRNGVNVAILRLPLVIGTKNPKGNLVSMMNGIRKGYYFRPGDGKAKKSMVLAEDIARLIPSLGGKNGTYNLTDRHHPSFRELDTALAANYGKTIKAIPDYMLRLLATIGDRASFLPFNSLKYSKMTATLTFNDDLAVKELGWDPRPVLSNLNS